METVDKMNSDNIEERAEALQSELSKSAEPVKSEPEPESESDTTNDEKLDNSQDKQTQRNQKGYRKSLRERESKISAREKELSELDTRLQKAKGNPIEVLRHLGVDVDEFITNYLSQTYEEEPKNSPPTPSAEVSSLKKEVEELKKQKAQEVAEAQYREYHSSISNMLDKEKYKYLSNVEDPAGVVLSTIIAAAEQGEELSVEDAFLLANNYYKQEVEKWRKFYPAQEISTSRNTTLSNQSAAGGKISFQSIEKIEDDEERAKALEQFINQLK